MLESVSNSTATVATTASATTIDLVENGPDLTDGGDFSLGGHHVVPQHGPAGPAEITDVRDATVARIILESSEQMGCATVLYDIL